MTYRWELSRDNVRLRRRRRWIARAFAHKTVEQVEKQMRIISVNKSYCPYHPLEGASLTGIFKERVEGRCAVKSLNLEGDRQADLRYTAARIRPSMPTQSSIMRLWRDFLGEVSYRRGGVWGELHCGRRIG